MTYTPTDWRDHLVPNPGRYRGTQNADGTWTFVEDFGVPAQVGTPISATNMNKIEQGIAEAHQRETQRSTTLVVAANNSTEKSKQSADYVVPNGAVDAQVTINAAINALPTGGGKIVLLEGTYTVNNSVVLKDNVTLEGLGDSTILKLAPSSSRITLIVNQNTTVGNSNITVSKLTLDGVRTSSIDGLGIHFTKVTNSVVSNLLTKDFYSSSISLNNCIEVIFAENRCKGNADGLWVSGDSKHMTIVGNVCISNTGRGIQFNGTHSSIIGNVSNSGSFGILVFGDYNTVANNYCGNNATGINASSGVSYCVIANNVCLDNSSFGINLSGNNSHNTVTGNVLTGNTNGGLNIGGGSYNSVQNNTIRKGRGSAIGIQLTTGATSNLVTNNDLYDSGTTKLSDGGSGTITNAGNRM